MNFLRTYLLRLLRNEHGSTIVIVAAALFIMVVAVGVAIDTSRVSASQSRLASALDAAGLAAGVSLSPQGACGTAPTTNSEANMNQCLSLAANNYFKANYPTGYLNTSTITITAGLVDNGNQIQLTAATSQTPSFMPLMGVSSVPLNVYTLINLPPPPQCGTVSASATAPTMNLCKVGTPTAATGNQYNQQWSWACNGSAGRTASCTSDLLGSCASSAPAASSTQPVPNSYTSLPANMCASGNPVFNSNYNNGINQQWGWNCNGTTNSNAAVNSVVCTSDLLGACNTTTESASTTTAPSGTPPLNLCAVGNPQTNAGNPSTVGSTVNSSTNRPNWSWTCSGTGASSNTVSCQSNVQAACGTAQNVSVATAPTIGFCASPDTNSGVGGGGTNAWSWSCYGTNTNNDITCGAPLTGTCGTGSPGACSTGTSTSVNNSGAPTDYWYCNGSAATSSGGGKIDTGTTSAKCTGNDGVCGTAANTCNTKGTASAVTGCPIGNDCWTCPPATVTGEPSGLCSAAQSNTGSATCGNINMTVYNTIAACDDTHMVTAFQAAVTTVQTNVSTADGTKNAATDPTVINLQHLYNTPENLTQLQNCLNGSTANPCSYGGISFTGTCQCASGVCGSEITLNDSNGDCTAPTCPTTLTAEPAGTKVTATCPTGELASSVSGTGPWTWTCSIGDATSPTCTVPVTPQCPTENTQQAGTIVTPTCMVGNPSALITSGGPWSWSCTVGTQSTTCHVPCTQASNGEECNGVTQSVCGTSSAINVYGLVNGLAGFEETNGELTSTGVASLIKNYSNPDVCGGISHLPATFLNDAAILNFDYSASYPMGTKVCDYICSTTSKGN